MRTLACLLACLLAWLPPALGLAHCWLRRTPRFSDLSNDTQFGVARHTHANDVDAHTGNQVFSCGSLAPKLRKGGCMDHGFSRAKQPWEATDGCVYLLRELALQKPEEAAQFMPTLAEVVSVAVAVRPVVSVSSPNRGGDCV